MWIIPGGFTKHLQPADGINTLKKLREQSMRSGLLLKTRPTEK